MTLPSSATPTTEAQDSAGFSLQDAARLLRRNWLTVLTSLLLGILLAAVWSLLQPQTYESRATAIVTAGTNENLGVALTADNLAKSKAAQYEELATSTSVAEDAVEKAGLNLSPAEAVASAVVTVPRDTPQIQIAVERPSPEEARRLADAWVAAIAENVQNIENSGARIDASGNATGGSGQSARPATNSSIIQVQQLVQASLPTSPHSPNVRLALLLGGAAGLLIGLALAAIRSVLDRRIRSAATITERFGTTVLAAIPALGGRGRRSTVGATRAALARLRHDDAQADPQIRRLRFRLTESFKELRTNLQFMNPDNPPRIIIVTSSLPGEGKTTVSTNLAITLAESQVPTVLVDGDLRRPVVAGSLGLTDAVGVTDVVIGSATLGEVLQPVPGYPELSVVASGRVPPNPSEILASTRFDTLIRELAREHMVIIDAPPLLPVTDAAILAARYDGCILVVRANHTTVDALGHSLENVSRVRGNVLGMVLNEVPTTGSGAAGYYAYYGDTYYSTDVPDQTPAHRRRSRRQGSHRSA